VIEHVSAGEQEHGNQAEGSPEVAVLQEGYKVWRQDCEESAEAKNSGRDGNDFHVVDGSRDGGLRNVRWDLSGNPCMNLFGALGATNPIRNFIEQSVGSLLTLG
jgi:hypothetical protein